MIKARKAAKAEVRETDLILMVLKLKTLRSVIVRC